MHEDQSLVNVAAELVKLPEGDETNRKGRTKWTE